MNDYAATSQYGGRIVTIGGVHLVVVDQSAAVAPDSDPELVLAAAARLLPINGREHKPVVAAAVDHTEAFVLRFPARHGQPFVTGAVEVQACPTLPGTNIAPFCSVPWLLP